MSTVPTPIRRDGYEEITLGDPSDGRANAMLARIDGETFWRLHLPDHDDDAESSAQAQNARARLAAHAALTLLQLNGASLSDISGSRTETGQTRERARAVQKAQGAWLHGNAEMCTILRPDWAENCDVVGDAGEAIEFTNSSMFAPVSITQEFRPVNGAWMPHPVSLINTADGTELTIEEALELTATLHAAIEFVRPVDENAHAEAFYQVAELLNVKPSRLLSLRSRRGREAVVTRHTVRCTARQSEGTDHENVSSIHRGEVHAWMDTHVREHGHDRRWPVTFAMSYSDFPTTFVEYRGPVKVTAATE